MTKRITLIRLCLILLAVCWIQGESPSQAQEARQTRPNILWIVCEDQNPVFGCYGDKVNKGHTPNVDKLAKRGTLFQRCYVPAPVCSPCRSALITGAMQTTLGIHNHRSARNKIDSIPLPKGVMTLPELFRAAGYYTFNVGKDDYNFDYERDSLYGKVKGNYPWRGRKKGQPFFGQIQLRGGKWFFALLSGNKKLEEPANRDDVEVPPYFPDVPTIREAFAVHEDTGRVTDMEVGQILARLAEDGLLENTIVIFFTDHGMPNSVRHKQFCYEGGVHVPLIIAGPTVPSGKTNNDLVSGLDISATTVALAGLKQQPWFEGQDLFGKDYQPRDYVISARDRCDYTIDRIRTVRTEKYRYIKNFLTDRPWMQPQYRDGRDFLEVVRKMHKAGQLTPVQARFYDEKRPAEELYDMENDPHQIHNLANDPNYEKVLQEHRTILNSWMKRTDDKGQYPESDAGLLAVMLKWGNKCVNPEYDRVRERYNELKKN